MKKYRAKPVEIEALKWDGSNITDVEIFMFPKKPVYMSQFNNADEIIGIETLEGLMVASLGDYIIKGTIGEFYPCKPEVFEKKYEEVSEQLGLEGEE